MPNKPSHSDREHATLGASSSDRWISCPGSIQLAEKLVEKYGLIETRSVYADEGTAAHELAHLCLLQSKNPIEFIDRQMPIGVYVDEEMAEGVQIYLDECRKYIGPDWEALTEKRFNLRALDPPGPMFGTCDFMAFNRKLRKLVVVDLKYGKGIMVDAEGNPQLRYYGLGALLTLQGVPIDEITLAIVQPRAFRGKKIKSTTVDVVELSEWSVELIEAARRTREPNAPLVSGDHCQFCPCSGRCDEQANANLREAQMEFSDCTDLALAEVGLAAKPPELRTLTPDQMAAINHAAPGIREFLNAVEKASVSAIQAGIDIPGWKVVLGEKRRAWKDKEHVGETLVKSLGMAPDDVFKRTIQTPKQVEESYRAQLKHRGFKPDQIKQYIDDLLVDLIHKPLGLPELAPMSDLRPALGARGSEFETIDAPEPENPRT